MKVLLVNGGPHPKGCTNRALEEVEKALKAIGREPVWKDWDASFDHMSKQLHTSAVQK